MKLWRNEKRKYLHVEIHQNLVCDAYMDAAAAAVCSEFYSVDVNRRLNTGRKRRMYLCILLHRNGSRFAEAVYAIASMYVG
jgi:hypothetical protein